MLPALISQATPRVTRMLEEGQAGATRAAPPATTDLEALRARRRQLHRL